PIPNNTGCIAAIKEAGWQEYNGERYINLQWQVLAPSEYKNRVIFQKVRVLDNHNKKADKAKRMLAAIDTNAGGHLLKLEQAPTYLDLMNALVGKMMAGKVMDWEMEIQGEERKGNWIATVAPKGKSAPAPAQSPSADFDDGSDSPF